MIINIQNSLKNKNSNIMKKTKLMVLLMGITILFSIKLSAQKGDFNGTWKLDYTKSVLVEYWPALAKINVQIKGDSLLTERQYDRGDGQIYPFTENLTLDGKEININIYGMPRKSSAKWSGQDGSLLLESTTTYTGETGSDNFVSKETWKVDNISKTLTISFKNIMSAGESNGAFVFNKSEPVK